MAVSAVSATSSENAAGLDFKSLMQIILQQLTYQDPLKPMDNFQFVSQMAQFSELQQIQSLNTSISTLLNTQASLQATGLLGRTVDFTTAGAPSAIGTVKSVTFTGGKPSLTISIAGGQTVANVDLSAITQVQ
jgi:flagellar basal-body rod modification protein FlgD